MAGMAMRPPRRIDRMLRAASLTLGFALLAVFVTAPLDGPSQAVLTVAGIAGYLVIDRFAGHRASLMLVVLSIAVTSRYLFWRLNDTLPFGQPLALLLGLGLIAAELYAGGLLALSYLQTAYPLNRKPIPLPPDFSTWPTVDVFVPSYNESLDLVRPTVFSALGMDWPREKLKVWILDDGRRPEFREFAEDAGCGYIVRPDNKGAKAGNINHALRFTDGDLIAIFDCDHAPTRGFLQLTVGWLVRDARIALVQTPHHFYSPDPFERNLARKRHVPNEGLLFYGLIQPGNDLWNAAFFCGSCAVLRRTALEETGGVPHETVTEDCHCSLRMQKRGWHTAYIRVPMAAGLATERLGLHIGQRMRWARGMLQILRQENTPMAAGLQRVQRLCYFASSFSFLFAIPRLVFLTAPTAFLFFGQNIIAASPLSIIAYAGAHMFHTFATSSRLNGHNRHSFWSEIYEATLAVPLVPITLLTLWDPRKGKFNVTDKGGTLDQGFLDLRVVWPMLTLFAIMLLAFSIGLYGTLTTSGLTFQAYLLNTIWAGLCLVPTSAAVAVGREREQSRAHARVGARVPAELVLSNGTRMEAMSDDISMSGARLLIGRPLGVADGDEMRVLFTSCDEVVETAATLLHWEGDQAFIKFHTDTVAREAAVTRLFFGRPDAWLHWDQLPRDQPLKSLVNVVLATADAVFRNYRFKLSKAPSRKSVVAAPGKVRVSDVVQPARGTPVAQPAARLAAGLLVLLLAAPALAQAPDAVPEAAKAAPDPFAAPLPPGGRVVRATLRELGLGGPMQMRGTQDLQGVLFGTRADEVVTGARLTLSGAASPALIPSLTQLAITLNEQPVGTIVPDASRGSFGPVEFDIDPLLFTDLNRLNVRFTGRYATDCNDPLSGLLWATVSDLSTLQMRIERLPPRRDLARLPEPLFDRRALRSALRLPFVVSEAAGPAGLRAAATAASYFAVEADYRGATFPVSRGLPPTGDAVLLTTGGGLAGFAMPALDGPTLALVPNPLDPFGTVLVVGGRNDADVLSAALALAAGRSGLGGTVARVAVPTIAARTPYAAPKWLPPDHPARFGSLVDPAELQAFGFAGASIRIPMRTAPDLMTWRDHGLPVRIGYRAPPGPIVDVAASRLDASVSDTFLAAFPMGDQVWQPLAAAAEWVGLGGSDRHGNLRVPPYMLLGRDELQLRFDMHPISRGDCAGIPDALKASIDPDSTIDISGAHRYASMPNLGYFGSAGFPFTRLADLSGTAVVMPERPGTEETGALLDLVGQVSAQVGAVATGLAVVGPTGAAAAGDRDLLVLGTLSDQPAFATLLRGGPLKVEGGKMALDLPDPLQDARALFLDAPGSAERTRASTALADPGEEFGALVGTESPLHAGRSVVALAGATPTAVARIVAALRDPKTLPDIKGDLTLFQGDAVTAFSTQARYGVGEVPWFMLPQVWLAGRPDRIAAIGLGAATLIGLPLFWTVRRRAALRLRARSTVGPHG